MKKFLIIFMIMTISLTALFAETGKPILTVLDFDTNEVSESEMKSIINILSSGMFKSGYFTVIDVAERETVLEELAFSMSGCTDESCMLELGKLLSAGLIVGGSISRLGSKIVLSAKMIETETSRTVSTADGVYEGMDELLSGIYIFRDQLAAPYSGDEAVIVVPELGAVQAVLNIPAISTAAAGIVCLGTGAYFLAVSLPLLFEYTAAQNAYDDAAAGSDFTALVNSAEIARLAAVEGNANTNFTIGASLAGGAFVLGAVSAILFFADKDEAEDNQSPVVQTAFIPSPGAATLSFRLNL